jgi:lysophospholipase L1-like esterase
MIGYWIVIAMTACAIAAVIVVATTQAPDHLQEAGTGANRPIVIAALGASDATGEGTRDPERENWVAKLAAQLPADVTVHNFGVGGSWLSGAYEEQLPSAIATEPDIVIAWLIVNDLTQGESLDDYAATLDLLLTDLAQPGRPILLGNAPQIWDLPAFTGDPEDIDELQEEVDRWNACLAEVAAKHKATIVDLGQNQVLPEDISADGFHPSAAGHAKLADTFYPHVMSAIESVRESQEGAVRD